MTLKLKKTAIKKLDTAQSAKKKYTVLVVDDEKAIVRSLVDTLEDDYDIITANDGQEALELIQNLETPESIHMIISDQRMPKMEGVDLLSKSIPIIPQSMRILLTGFTDVDAIIDSINKGEIYRFLTKPITPQDLLFTVKQAMEIYELRGENERLVTELQGALKVKNDFMANVSHELRTPMNAILGMIHLARQGTLSSKQNKHLNKAHSAAKSLLGIITNILDFSEIEVQTLTLESNEFHLDTVMGDVSSSSKERALEKGLDFSIQVSSSIPKFLVGDDFRLWQILNHLVDNAIKFTKTGEIILSVTVAKDENEIVVLQFAVQDTGVGIEKKQLSKLFESFTQADATSTRKFGGLGLGLTLSLKLVKMMGGDIKVESEVGHGSSFLFTAKFKKDQKSEFENSKLRDSEISSSRTDTPSRNLELIKENNGGNPDQSLDFSKINALIQSLKELLEDDNTEASSIIEELKPHIIGTEGWKNLAKVEHAIGTYDFEEALEYLNEFITQHPSTD